MPVHLINPSDVSFGAAVITPRWLYVLAAATPAQFGDPHVVDETLEQLDLASVAAGDVVGIGIHTLNALRGYELGRAVRARGAHVVYGGIHATLFPDEPFEQGGADAVVTGDGDRVWAQVIADCHAGTPQRVYAGGKIPGCAMQAARWDLLSPDKYMIASVQTLRGCPKHCSFCSVWRTDGQLPRVRGAASVIEEIVQLRRLGFRLVALADDNFYPVTLADLRMADRRADKTAYHHLKALRDERFTLMAQLAKLPPDMVFFTQITMEAAEDPEYLDAMGRARIRGALVGIEAVTPEGLKDIHKDFNLSGDALAARLQEFKKRGVHVLGSFIFGLPSDRPQTFDATAALAQQADVTLAQFVMLTPFPGTLDFKKWEASVAGDAPKIGGVPVTRHWLIPKHLRPKVYAPHPVMSADEIRQRTQRVWDEFYRLPLVWQRAKCVKSLKSRLAFVMISKLYRQMYANTGISTDSARSDRARRMTRLIVRPLVKLMKGTPMPLLQVPA
ncbi:MAG: radical SAM protein [Acidobacteriota bacterium]|nr:radical SAM protein [Acidobacteriota bacterium]